MPDPELGAEFSDCKLSVSIVREDSAKDVWITGEGYHDIIRHAQVLKEPLLGSDIKEMWAMQLDPDRTCWASGVEPGRFPLSAAAAVEKQL